MGAGGGEGVEILEGWRGSMSHSLTLNKALPPDLIACRSFFELTEQELRMLQVLP